MNMSEIFAFGRFMAIAVRALKSEYVWVVDAFVLTFGYFAISVLLEFQFII